MSVINAEYLEGQGPKQKFYRIEIRNFRKKLGKAQMGEKVSSKKFFVNSSEFSIDIYIAGDTNSDGNHLSLYVTNHSDWMVRARKAIYVNGVIFEEDGPFSGFFYKAGDADNSENSLGWPNCIPLWRCINNDLLSHDGILTIQVLVDVLAQNAVGCRGGVQKQLSAMREEVSGLKRKLEAQDTELREIKSKMRQVEMKKEIKTEKDC